MANTVQYYQELITQQYVSGAAALGITIDPVNWSITNLDRLVIRACAYCAFIVDSLFDLFKADVNETIAALKPHSERWYAEKAKLFQYGYNLPPDSVDYDNTGILGSVVAFSRIVAYAAVIEQSRGLRIKVAKDEEGTLVPLDEDQLTAFIAYMKKVKDAGVKLNITSTVADNLKANIHIIYNPLVLKNDGSRLDGLNAEPVQTAIKDFLNNLPFNGVFSIQKLIDAIQAVDGVSDLRINSISARYGELPFSTIDIDYTPDSGYLRIEVGDLVISFASE